MSDEAQEPLTPQAALDQKYMKLALEQAELAAQIGEVPIGAVVVCDGEVIAVAHNRREIDNDPSAHAEFLAMQRLQKAWPLETFGLYGLRDAGTLLDVCRADGQCSY